MVAQIFMVEDHPLMRRAYGMLLHREPDLNVCGAAASGEEALTRMPDCQPDLVLVDISLPGMNGLMLSEQLYQTQPGLPILIVSAHEYTVLATRIVIPSVKGYIQKHQALQLLVPTIRGVLAL